MIIGERFESVRDALEDHSKEAARLKVTSELMIALELKIKSWGISQPQASKRLGTDKQRYSALMRGHISEFTVDDLIKLAAQAGLSVRLDIAEAA